MSVPSGINPGGCLPRNAAEEKVRLPLFGETDIEPLDRREWPAYATESLANIVWKIVSQGRTDMCASFATCAAIEILIRQQTGLKILLSPSSVYNSITGGRPGGSTIYSNLRQTSTVGVLPASVESNRETLAKLDIHWDHTRPLADYRVPGPRNDAERETAALFRIAEWFDLNDWDAMISTLSRSWPVVYGRSSHAVCGIGYRHRGRISIPAKNSWGEDWGEEYGGAGPWDSGFFDDSESLVRPAISQYGAFAPRYWDMDDRFVRALNS